MLMSPVVQAMIAILRGLYMFHRKSRLVEQEKRAQYWREQVGSGIICPYFPF